jgi:hypothetical protein
MTGDAVDHGVGGHETGVFVDQSAESVAVELVRLSAAADQEPVEAIATNRASVPSRLLKKKSSEVGPQWNQSRLCPR